MIGRQSIIGWAVITHAPVIALLWVSGCTTIRDCAGGPVHSRTLPVRAWWTKTSTALEDLKAAREFGVNTVIIEHDGSGVGWNTIIDGLAVYDFSADHRRTGADRQQVELRQEQYRAILDQAARRGIQTYVMCPEIDLPDSALRVSYEDEQIWRLIQSRLQEVFQALPDLNGFMLYLCEGQLEVFDMPGEERSMASRAHRLIDTVWEACRAERRKLLVTTFIHHPARLQAIAEALRRFPSHPDLAVVQYCCPNDWGLYEVLNPSIGRVGPHPEILAFDYAGENWGQGAHPFVQIEFMARRLRQARGLSPNIAGLAGYVAWYGRRALGTFNEANIYAGAALAADPDRDPHSILLAWCTQRFGERAAGVAAECLARTQPAVFAAQHVFGYWLDTTNKSGLPALAELDEYFIRDAFGEALGKWDPAHLPVWKRIQSPDAQFVEEMLAEKETAIALTQQSLRQIRSARQLFQPADFEALESAFEFQVIWFGLWRDLTHAFFLRQIALRRGWTPEQRKAVDAALSSLVAGADTLEARFGPDVFPRGPERAQQFAADLRREMQ
ncbi:MAG: hypothetical protein AMXMBFR13_51460 [Phycisphaerae bacterium]